jgi:hypothetical protein
VKKCVCLSSLSWIGTVIHFYNPSTRKAEEGGSQVPVVQREFQATQRFCFKKQQDYLKIFLTKRK